MNSLQKLSILILLLTFTTAANAQLGVAFHQSTFASFVDVNYSINRYTPSLRIGTDNYLESVHLEPVLTYNIIQKEDFSFYAGTGVWIDENYLGIVFPIGLNVFPFANKQFGFHIELTPLYLEDAFLRGSWGIRYQFGK